MLHTDGVVLGKYDIINKINNNCSLTVKAVRSTLRVRTLGNHLTVIWLSLDRDKPLV